MRTFLETLKRFVNLLMQVAGVVVDALRSGARKAVRAVVRAVCWLGESTIERAPSWSLVPVLVPSTSRDPGARASLARYEQLLGWRLHGAPTSKAHELAA